MSADQIRATATDGQRWLLIHPCPDEKLGDRFDRLFER
jgi:hypothetical protein